MGNLKIEVECRVRTNQVSDTLDVLLEFNHILNSCHSCNSLAELELRLRSEFNDFEYGFGGSHFWLKQKLSLSLSDRILFVTEK